MDDCPECSYLTRKDTGDTTVGICSLSNKPCLREENLECETYNEWLMERDLWDEQ